MVILKISLGIFYLRIAVERWQKWTIYITVGISTIFGTYYFFAAIFQCGNPSNFLRNAVSGKCSSGDVTLFAVNMTAGVINATSDLILAVLPITIIRKACMPMRAKVSAMFVLLLGCTGSAISLVRLSYLGGLAYDRNFFESGVSITVWSIAEAGICIIAVSLATLRPLFRRCLDGTRHAMTTSGHRSGQKGSQASYSTAENTERHSRPQRPPRPASPMSFADRGMRSQRGVSGRWPFTPGVNEGEDHLMEDLQHGVVRRASFKDGKIVWTHEYHNGQRLPAPPPVPPLPTAAQRPSPRRSASNTPPESPIIPSGFRQSIARGSQALRNLPKSPSWPKSPPWPRSPPWASSPRSNHSSMQPPPLRQAISSWKPPNSRPSDMVRSHNDRVRNSSQGYLPLEEHPAHRRQNTPSNIGPYESVYDPRTSQFGPGQGTTFFNGPTPGSTPPDDLITALPQPPPLPPQARQQPQSQERRSAGFHPSGRFKPGYERSPSRQHQPISQQRTTTPRPQGEQIGLGAWRVPKGSLEEGRGKMF